ncbi:hypothetical protein GCM10010440_58460 [Kitasatospora cinereorecta]
MDGVEQTGGPTGRRALLRAGAGLAAGAAAGVAAPAPAAPATTREAGAGAGAGAPERSVVLTGRLDSGAPDFVHLPVEVPPPGVREIAVAYSYHKPPVPPGTPGNACDIGIFDERGTALGGRGFRGWSGGFRQEFAISRSAATPGYLPGPVRPGTWHVVLGPYQVAPQGMNYRVEVTLRLGEPGPAFVPAYPPERARGGASLASYVRAEVRHPRADGTPGRGNSMGPDLPWGPMAALTNPVFLRST